MLSRAVVTCTIWASVGGRLSAAATLAPRHRCRYRLPRRPPWYGAIRATPSLPTQTGPVPPREDATRMSGRESRGSAGSPGRGAGPDARRHGAAASQGGGRGARGERAEGGAARREGRAEFDSRMAYGMPSTYPPVHICGHESIPPFPCCISAGRGLHVGCRVGARRARSVEVDTWARGTAGLSRGYDVRLGPSRQPRYVPSQS